MKKILACGLILSTLMSFGSMCLAAGRDEPDLCYKTEHAYGGVILTRENGSKKVIALKDDEPVVFACSDNERYETVYFNIDEFQATSVELWVNIGDGEWRKSFIHQSSPVYVSSKVNHVAGLSNAGTIKYVATRYHSDFQYKLKLTREDGSSETVKFMGWELMSNDGGDFDMSSVCLRDVKVGVDLQAYAVG